MSELSDIQLLILEKHQLNCDDFDELLADYVEESLPETLQHRLDAHVESCEACQDGLELYQQVISIAGVIGKTSERATMPDDIRRRLHDRLNLTLGLKLGASQ